MMHQYHLLLQPHPPSAPPRPSDHVFWHAVAPGDVTAIVCAFMQLQCVLASVYLHVTAFPGEVNIATKACAFELMVAVLAFESFQTMRVHTHVRDQNVTVVGCFGADLCRIC